MSRKTSWNLFKRAAGLLPAVLLAGVFTVTFAGPGAIKLLPGGGAGGGGSDLSFRVSEAQVEPGAQTILELVSSQDIVLLDAALTIQFTPDVFINNPAVGFSNPSVVFSVAPQGPGTYRITFQDPTGSLQIEQGKFMTLSGIVRQNLVPGATVDVQVTADATRADGLRLIPANGLTSLPLVADDANLVLRVDGESGLVAGETVVVEVRTYNPKPISEGQICFRFATTFFSSVNSVTIKAAEPDVSFTSDTTQSGIFLVQFTSPSAAVNRLDGPMLEVEMVLATDLAPDAETFVSVDLLQTYLLDASGQPVVLDTRGGRFKVSP